MIYNQPLRESDPRISTAEAYARGAHQGLKQVRRYNGEPYINHPARCAEMAAEFGLPAFAVAGLWLHDVPEDTGVELEEIRDVFGESVYSIVSGLTNVYTKDTDGVYDIRPRARRHATSLSKLQRQPTIVKVCRMIDSYDNLRDFAHFEKRFARAFIPEKRDIWRLCSGTHFQIHHLLGKRLDEAELMLAGKDYR